MHTTLFGFKELTAENVQARLFFSPEILSGNGELCFWVVSQEERLQHVETF
jgi:hypothetical protein